LSSMKKCSIILRNCFSGLRGSARHEDEQRW
jgi:hypothetical protein